MTKKKLIISLLAFATLVPLAGCYSPYYDRGRYGYYDSYGYYHADRYAPRPGYDRYGYRDYRDTTPSDRDTGRAEGTRPGDPYYDNYTPRP